MPDDQWADPVEQLVLGFTKEGLKQACFDRDLSMAGTKADLALRLYDAGHSAGRLLSGRF